MSGSLYGVMVAHWPGIPEMWVRVPLPGTIFPVFITPATLVADHDPIQAMCCMVVEPTLCMYM